MSEIRVTDGLSMKPLLCLLVFLLSIGSELALAVDLPEADGEQDLLKFLKESQANPNRIFILKASATWCHPCQEEKKELKGLQGGEIGKARWLELDIDKLDGPYNALLKKLEVTAGDGIPFHLMFKNGEPVGSYTGNNLDRMAKFLGELEAYSPPKKAQKLDMVVPKFPCGSKNSGECVVGLSGYKGTDPDSTDWFGQSNLVGFSKLFGSPQFSKLFAPPVLQHSTKDSDNGGLLFVQNPFKSSQVTLAEGAGFPTALDELDMAPGASLRILMTGHGGKEGITYDAVAPPNETHKEEKVLNSDDFGANIDKAVAAGKTVRLLGVQCYGGQFSESIMPRSDTAPIHACGAFASLPDKEAEGCYDSAYSGERQDYLWMASKLKKCDGTQNARDLHYEIVSKSEGHDIPMLSSEYFLLYGPAAKSLTAGDGNIDAPMESIAKAELSSDIELYFDRIHNRVIKVTQKGKELPKPELRLINCTGQNEGYSEQIDGEHLSYFFLQTRATGKNGHEAGDCAPTYKLHWEASTGIEDQVVSFEKYYKNESVTFSGSQFPLNPGEMQINISDLRPEARMLFQNILPRVNQGLLHNDGVVDNFKALRDQIQQYDPALARAISSLMTKFEQISKKDNPKSGPYWSDVSNALFTNLSSEQKSSDLGIVASRLAHLLASAAAEMALRDSAKTDPWSKDLLKQLDALKACERDLM